MDGPLYTGSPDPIRLTHDPVATQRAAEAEIKTDHLEREVQHLALICESLWKLLKEKHGYNDQELLGQVAALQANEYRSPGRRKNAAPRLCPKCSRTAMRHQFTCAYCATQLPPTLFD